MYAGTRKSNLEDTALTNFIRRSMDLPDGQLVRARHSESYVHATLDPKLKATLKMDQDGFAFCLDRGVITLDGLPYADIQGGDRVGEPEDPVFNSRSRSATRPRLPCIPP
jgi:hypothetical protein